MADDFFSNLQAVTENISDIAFTRYATITNLNSDGTCTAKEDEDGVTHESVLTLSHNLKVGDTVVIGFVDNSIYNPVVLGSTNETNTNSYSKGEIDGFVDCLINRLDDGGDDEGGGGTVTGLGIDIDMLFTGVSGRDDTITLKADLIYVTE